MERLESKITARGQVTVPARIRRRLGLTPMSQIEWFESGGEVMVRWASKYSSREIHEAVFDKPPKSRSADDMNEGIRRWVRLKFAPG